MALQDDLRTQIIKQFPADVIILTEKNGAEYYACPTCKHQVGNNADKCTSCDQKLKWDNIQQKIIESVGLKKATLSFEVPGDFYKSDCRKCPLSYIAKTEGQNVYECPLKLRNNCPLEFEE